MLRPPITRQRSMLLLPLMLAPILCGCQTLVAAPPVCVSPIVLPRVILEPQHSLRNLKLPSPPPILTPLPTTIVGAPKCSPSSKPSWPPVTP